jgi:hypothetical protein
MSKRRKGPQATPKREKVRDIYVGRPFEGLADETEWIAMRELIPAASAPLRLKPEIVSEYGDSPVTISTVLPMAWPATKPGETVTVPSLPGPGPRLQDILEDGPLEITIHEGFEYWLDAEQAQDENVKASLERANASIYPTVRLAAAHAAYWCRVPDKSHVRWVLPDEEDGALNALARLSAAGDLKLGDATKFAGMFRAHGLLVPVWDVPGEPEAADWEGPLAAFAKRYADTLGDTSPLEADARRAKQGLVGRQLTLR